MEFISDVAVDAADLGSTASYNKAGLRNYVAASASDSLTTYRTTSSSFVGASGISVSHASIKTRSSPAASSVAAATATVTASPLPTDPASSHGLSIGAKAGIGTGVTILVCVVIIMVVAVIMRRKKKPRRRDGASTMDGTAAATAFSAAVHFDDKAELENGRLPPEGVIWREGVQQKSEMITRADAHEMEGTGVSATSSEP